MLIKFQEIKTMELYEKVSTNLNFVEREKATRKFWEENDVFARSIDARADGLTSATFLPVLSRI